MWPSSGWRGHCSSCSDLAVLCFQLGGELGVLIELDAVAGHHVLELGLPALEVLGEGLLQQFDHDRNGGGRTRGGAQQGADGTVAAGNDFGAELQDAALLRVLLDDLYTLAGGDQFPVAVLGFRVVLAQGLNLVPWRLATSLIR